MKSRLEQHQQKNFRRTIILIIIVIFAIVYFIFSYGFKLLLTVSTFIASLNNRKSETQIIKKEDEYGLISIDSIPSSTNSAKIYVGGSVINFNKVYFYINGDQVKDINLNSSDNFNEIIGDLKVGNNEIFVKGKQDDKSAGKKTKIYNIIYKDTKPKLDITEPQDNTKTSKNEITIKGSTDKETFIKINNLPIVVDSLGNFQTTLMLQEGDNNITISAEDIAGNTENKTMKVAYQKD